MKWMLPRNKVVQEASKDSRHGRNFGLHRVLCCGNSDSDLGYCRCFQAFCIVYARYASAKCARIARENGLDANLYAKRGAWRAALLLVPWVHLVRKMEGKPYSFGTSEFGYAPLYILWLVIVAANVSILIMTVLREGPWSWYHTAIVLVPVALGMFPWLLTLFLLLRKRTEFDERTSNAQDDVHIEPAYILPFIGTSTSILAIPCVALIGIVVGLVMSAGIFAIPMLFIVGVVAWLVLLPFF